MSLPDMRTSQPLSLSMWTYLEIGSLQMISEAEVIGVSLQEGGFGLRDTPRGRPCEEWGGCCVEKAVLLQTGH